jgi:hypothetical protein
MHMQVSEIIYRESPANPINPARVEFYKGEFRAKRDVEPILVDENQVLVGGVHRLSAAKALGHKTIAVESHVQTPLDLHGRKGIADAISQATESVKPKFVDRRDPVGLRNELANFQVRHDLQEKDRQYCAASVVEVTGKLVAQQKLLAKYEKLVVKQPHYQSGIEDLKLRIRKLQRDLDFAKDREARLTKIVDSIKKQIVGFLAHQPEGFPSNAQLLKEAAEVKNMERELAAL